MQSKSIPACSKLPRSGIDDIICDAHLNYMVENDMVSRVTAVMGVVDPHSSYAGDVQPAGGRGAGTGGGGRNRKRRRLRGGQQQQPPQQQQEPQSQQDGHNTHGHPKQNGGDKCEAALEGITDPQRC